MCAEVLSLRERDYVEAARAIGASAPRIVLVHIAPNVLGLILTVTTLDMASQVVNEATLSLLGLCFLFVGDGPREAFDPRSQR